MFTEMPGQRRRLGQPGALSAESSRNRRLEAQRERLLREALMVLLHHNIVSCAPVKPGTEKLDTHMYRLHIDDIVHRLSHPRYCEHIKAQYSGEAATDIELLVLALFKMGKLTRPHAIKLALEDAKLLGGARRKGGEQVRAALDEAWQKLLKERYIVKAQSFSGSRAAEGDAERGASGGKGVAAARRPRQCCGVRE